MPQGFVYILVSPNSNYVKIGGTEKPIRERLRAINASRFYGNHGPWGLSDFLHVTDWRTVEVGIHKFFQKKKVQGVQGTRELFDVPPHEVRERLRIVDRTLRIGHEKTEQLFNNRDVHLYLYRLFQLTGLFGSLDIQGAWTLSLLPATKGGRWFTLNIGPHEVAFSTRKAMQDKFIHYLILDRLILEYPHTIKWLKEHDGKALKAHYQTARDRAAVVDFVADFASAERLFSLPGIRRALIAYWSEALADLRERNAKSPYSRYHSYDAVSELARYKRATEQVFDSVTDAR